QAPSASGSQILATQLAAFNATYSNARVSIVPKKPYGKGGIVDLLLTTQAALPQALPDVVALDLRELPRLSRESLLQSFDSQFSPALLNDLYPFARQAGQVDGRLLAIPFTADVLHGVYDSAQIQSPPLTWSALISSTARYAFAAGGENALVNDSFLAQYVALGGHFSDARGKPALDRVPLRDALEFYRNGLARGVIAPNVAGTKTADETWRLYLTAKASLADVSTRDYLRDRAQLKNAAYAPIPTRSGNLATISRSWGYAIATQDPARRVVAERFIEWMLTADNNAAWNRAASRLPVRRSALNLWSSDAAYRDFINPLLLIAVNRPVTAAGDTLDIVLQTAIVDVLANNLTPAEAADKAITTLAR
ncbi:MAG: extracellular solute-binding protein, partial [Chloroflexi bacterium]|nr:extracellular solute-binding protein [Chloroflexota bacterium]